MDRRVVVAVHGGCGRPLPRREVHFALENDGWNCTFECEVHVSEPGGRPGRPSPWPVGPVRSPGCPLWSSPGLGRPFQRPVPATDRPVAPFPGVRSDAGCPNLPQRPGSSRSAREESLIFRASSRRRSRPGAPLWQIRTRPRPGPSHQPRQHQNPGAPRVTFGADLVGDRGWCRSGSHDASSAQRNPPQLARCELSLTKST